MSTLSQNTRHSITMKVRPQPSLKPAVHDGAAPQALLADAPFAMLGAPRQPAMANAGIAPRADTCFGPRGAALLRPEGPLWVCDTGHHRLLGWRELPDRDGLDADWIIGQADFRHEGRNAKAGVGAATVNVPTGICACGEGMAVADAWNHRVLIWHRVPRGSHVAADIVLGQPDFHHNAANRGRDQADADSMHWPYGVAWLDGKLFVADSENRRVLIWDGLPQQHGQAADRVLGQHDFVHRDENAGTDADAMSMRWPHGIALWQGHLCVADAGNNRIMIWRGIPEDNGTPCDVVLGQKTLNQIDHNQSLYWPRANTLNMPYALAAMGPWLLVADTASSRLLGWHIDDLATGAAARALCGQHDFHDKGDNRWQLPCADSLCWPYGIQACGNTVVVADSGNNRVSLWHPAS